MSEENHAQNIYKMKPRQVRAAVIDCVQAGLVPFVQSSPGMGKSTIVRSIANEYGLKVIDHRVSTSSPVDFSGLPDFYTDEDGIRRAGFTPFDIFPVAGTKVPKGYDGWMMFLDEFNSGQKNVQAAAYKLILDRMNGQYPLHDKVVMALAGNLATDRAITNMLSTAMQSRVIHIEMIIDFDEWLKDVAIPEQYDRRIIGYLSYKKSNLMDFRPEHNEKTFCCPRTWEFANRLIRNHEGDDLSAKQPILGGTITSGVAADFVTYSKVYLDMIKVQDVLRSPKECEIPGNPMARWAVITHLIENVTNDNFGDISLYVNRYPNDFRMLFYRYLLAHQPKMRRHPTFADAMVELAHYLND